MDKYHWTEHAKFKMKFYGLSPQRVLRVIRNPERVEEGIVEKTIAVMQPTSTKKDKNGKTTWSSEIWVMYQTRVLGTSSKSQIPISKKTSNLQTTNYKLQTNQLKIISAWRYPGVSPKNNPIPEEVLRDLEI